MKIAICDDQKKFLNKYSSEILSLAKENDIEVSVSKFESGEGLIFALNGNFDSIDLLLLDINFPKKMDGLSTAKELREKGFKNDIIFVTVDSAKVFDAFDVDAFHYIVKGETSKEKEKEILLRAMTKVTGKKGELIALSCAGENRNIPIEELQYFEIVNRIVEAHYDGKIFKFYSTIARLENTLADKGFMQVHRSFLVSLNKIVSMKNTMLQMEDGTEVPIGRTYYKKVRELLKGKNLA